MPSSTTARASGSRATLATKLVPRSSIGFLSAQIASHFRSRFKRRAYDRRIAGAAAQMPRQQIADCRFVRPRNFAQEEIERHQDARGAEAALKRVVPLECGLQDAEPARRGREALDGSQLAALDLHGERQAGARGLAVDVDG